MENSFLASLQQEGDQVNLDNFNPTESEREEKETPLESPARNKPDGKTDSPSEDKNKDVIIPKKSDEEEPAVYHAFHEHPKWIAREQELKELREQNQKLEQFRERAEPLFERLEMPTQEKKNSEVPEWFITLYGDDKEVWKQYQTYSAEERKQIITAVRQELQPFIEIAQHSKQQSELDNWASKEWKLLENDIQVQTDLKRFGLSLDKNVQEEISNIITKYLPTDEETGNLSIRKGFELWKEIKAKSVISNSITNEKKQIADKTIKKSNATEEIKDYKTSADFKGKYFTDLPR